MDDNSDLFSVGAVAFDNHAVVNGLHPDSPFESGKPLTKEGVCLEHDVSYATLNWGVAVCVGHL